MRKEKLKVMYLLKKLVYALTDVCCSFQINVGISQSIFITQNYCFVICSCVIFILLLVLKFISGEYLDIQKRCQAPHARWNDL